MRGQTKSSSLKSINSFSSNGSFETGNFQSWRTIGDTSIETGDIGISPTDGNNQALITNGFSDSGGSVEESDLSEFLDLPDGALDGLLGGDATEGSGVKRVINANAGDILKFDYTFLTNEGTPNNTYNDSAFFSINGFTQELADTSDPTFSNKSVQGFSEATDTKSISVLISKAGEYNLSFGTVDLTDSVFDSGLLIDNVSLSSTGDTFSKSSSLSADILTDSNSDSSVDFVFGGSSLEAI